MIPGEALACACGCSVFDVGSTSLLPKEGDHGGVVYFEWDHSDQNRNWSGTSKAPADNNGDKRIPTDWYVVGMNYMINRDWGVGVRIPTANRAFTTDTNFGATPAAVETFHASVVGDIELTGMYTGLSKDMSKGLIFGVKLPTGNYTAPNFDRDTQIGTGSTDLILGGFWRGMITGRQRLAIFQPDQIRAAACTSPQSDGGLAITGLAHQSTARRALLTTTGIMLGHSIKSRLCCRLSYRTASTTAEPPRILAIPATTGFSSLPASTSPR